MRKVLSSVSTPSLGAPIQRVSFLDPDDSFHLVEDAVMYPCQEYFFSNDEEVFRLLELCRALNKAPERDGKRPVLVTLGESHARLLLSVLKIPVVFVDISERVNNQLSFQLKCLSESPDKATFVSRYFGKENPQIKSGEWDAELVEDLMFANEPDFRCGGIDSTVTVADINLFSPAQVKHLGVYLEEKGLYVAGLNLSNLLEYDSRGNEGSYLRRSLPQIMRDETLVLNSNCRRSWVLPWAEDPIGTYSQFLYKYFHEFLQQLAWDEITEKA